jgi:thioredoxin-dependent peroxiredoxin
MSKKTRKKSSKPSTGKAIRAQSAKSAKSAPSKTRGATATTKSSKNTKNRQTGTPTAKASHKAPSKKLKSSPPGKLTPRTATASKAATSKPAVGSQPVRKPPVEKASGSPAPRSAPSAPLSVALSVPLAEGAKAPAFSLPRDGGSTASLNDYAGQKLVLFFYPRADTPGCTKEAIDFTRLASAFADAQTAVLGVSADPIKAQESFRNKHQLSIPLISDEQHEMLEAYGVWGEKSMYGRIFLGILRTTVLIGADGRIVRIWRNVKVDGHAEEVLAAAEAG